jgi:hypothetical protein
MPVRSYTVYQQFLWKHERDWKILTFVKPKPETEKCRSSLSPAGWFQSEPSSNKVFLLLVPGLHFVQLGREMFPSHAWGHLTILLSEIFSTAPVPEKVTLKG